MRGKMPVAFAFAASCASMRSGPISLLSQSAPRALLVSRDGEDPLIGDALESKLGSLRRCTSEEALRLLETAGAISAVFELSADGQSIELAAGAVACGGSLYRYQTGAAAFRRIAGDAGPNWLTPAASFEQVAESKGLGFIGDDRYGDDDRALDVTELSDAELAHLLGLPPPDAVNGAVNDVSAGGGEALPAVSELGYALSSLVGLHELEAAAAQLTQLARDVLLRKATEPPHSWRLADGAPFTPDAHGVYLCALSGCPIYGSDSVQPSSSGWPSFRAYPASHPLAQHVRTAPDVSAGEVRTEIVDAKTGAHLGHRRGTGSRARSPK